MRLLIYIAIVGCLVGCGSGRTMSTQQTNRTVSDSSWVDVKTVQKDTVITIPGDTTFIKVPVYDLTEEYIRKTSGRSSAALRKVGDDIEVICECLEYKQKIEYLETIIEKNNKIVELQETIINNTKIEYRTPWYSKALNVIGGGAIIFTLINIIKRFKP